MDFKKNKKKNNLISRRVLDFFCLLKEALEEIFLPKIFFQLLSHKTKWTAWRYHKKQKILEWN